MEKKAPNPRLPRSVVLPKKSEKKSDFDKLVDSAGFLVALGLLILGAGLICYGAFHNRLGMYFFEVGFALAVLGIGAKMIDIAQKVFGGRK